MSRPLVTVLSHEDGTPTSVTVPLPAVFTAPIRPDVVHHVHSCMAKNSRQAYAVSVDAGKQHSAESWGTGRAVSRIPRVAGGGTHAAGAGAFGNMCRGGRMFAPNKVRATRLLTRTRTGDAEARGATAGTRRAPLAGAGWARGGHAPRCGAGARLAAALGTLRRSDVLCWPTANVWGRLSRPSSRGCARRPSAGTRAQCRKGALARLRRAVRSRTAPPTLALTPAAPAQSFRKWHVKISQNQRRYAVASALAASAIPALVMARGHRIDDVEEVPLVVSDGAEKLERTSAAIELLGKLGAAADLKKVTDSKKLRSGKGKMRNRRYVMRRGPLVIYKEGGKACPIERAFRNIPGVELCAVDRLNLLQLAPGGHLGRFCVWTQGAFAALDSIYGTHETPSAVKRGFHLPYSSMTNADLSRVINSDEVQAVVRPTKTTTKRAALKKNPLKNFALMQKLNPAAATAKRRALTKELAAKAKKAALIAAKREGKAPVVSEAAKKAKKAIKESGKAWYKKAIAGTDII